MRGRARRYRAATPIVRSSKKSRDASFDSMSIYGNASTLMKNRNEPDCMTPNRNCTLTESPLASGLPSEMKPAFIVLFHPPPLICVGGCSSVVPRTVTRLPLTMTAMSFELLARRSAWPDTGGEVNVVISTIRKRNRVTELPVLFVKVRLTDMVPNCELFPGSLMKSRVRFGDAEEETDGSSNAAPNPELRLIALERFSGPG